METSLTIPKNPAYPPGMDFARLRREGIRHIERMGSAIWTDYNNHDPGITILDVLCYALTDLGYRTNLAPSDLFATNPDEPGRKPYYTAAEILPNEPVTAHDIRKILIDIPGIHNAWVSARQEPDVLVRLNPELTVGDEEKALYQTFIKVIEDELKNRLIKSLPATFSLSTTVTVQKTKTSSLETLSLTAVLTQWYTYQRDCERTLARVYETAFYQGLIRQLIQPVTDNQPQPSEEKISELVNTVGQHWIIRSMFSQLLVDNLAIESPVEEDGTPTTPNYTLYIPQGIYQISLLLEAHCDPGEIVQVALAQLHAHRNLSEDFHAEFTLIERQPIALCTNIEIASDAHADEVLPLLYEAISEYLSPTPRFYSLQEMMDRNGVFYLSQESLKKLATAQLPDTTHQTLTPLLTIKFTGRDAFMHALQQAVGSDIFPDYEALLFYHAEKRYDAHPVYQGPLLTHGFLDDAELDAAQLRQTVYKSDLYQLMLTVPGVVSIQSLVMGRCYHEEDEDDKEGRRGLIDDSWCLACGCSCLPELDIDCSTFSFTKGYGYGQPDVQMAREQQELLRMKHTAVDRQGSLDLVPPTGLFRPDLAEFTSIQEDFPRTYHIGREGIARTKPAVKQARVKQLKAFLLLFDQVLANYLAHLADVRNLLAIDQESGGQPDNGFLFPVPAVPGLLPLLINEDPTAYQKAVNDLMNGSAVEKDLARNRLLDHLMARFGEQFTDYALQYYPIERPAEASPYGDLSAWIGQKQLYLKQVPGLGSGRGRGFNYRTEPLTDNLHVWNSSNVAGLKRRVCALLGMPQSPLERMPKADEPNPFHPVQADWTRHPISTEPAFFVVTFSNNRRRYHFGLKTAPDEADNLLVSTALYAKRSTADEAAQHFFDRATDPLKYGIRQLPTKQWEVGFWELAEDTGSETIDPLLRSPLPFLYEFQARQVLEEIKKLAVAQDQDDSFHLIEHILLRPRDDAYQLLRVETPAPIPPLLQLDPYSFRLTVVVPAWVKRFSDPRLLAQFDQTLRLETPAHLYVSIYRYDRPEMLRFETAYLDWLLASSEPEREPFALRDATNALIDVLNTARQQALPTELLKAPDCLSNEPKTP